MKVIVHVENGEVMTGAAKALFATCAHIPGYRHIFVVPRGSTLTTRIDGRYVVYELPFVELGKTAKKIITYLPALVLNGIRLRRILIQENAVALHMNDLYNLTGYVARI